MATASGRRSPTKASCRAGGRGDERSLPEEIGGTANWDYRFAWLGPEPDEAGAVAACPHEPTRVFRWLGDAMGHLGGVPLQIMYRAEGERRLDEYELGNLTGYRDSRPVRAGNAGWQQRQLDVLGEVVFVAALLRDQLEPFDTATVELLRAIADEA
jgi:GH15 family glucan-1,4-alpha-glucosidase